MLLVVAGTILVLLISTLVLSPGAVTASSIGVKNATPQRQEAGQATEGTQVAQAGSTATPTDGSGKWETSALRDLADSLGWPTEVTTDGSGRLSVTLYITDSEQARVFIKPFDYSSGAEAAFQAEQQDAEVAGLQVTPGEFYTFPSYTASGSQGGVTDDRRLHWITGDRIMGVDISGVGDVMQALDPATIGQLLIQDSIEHGLPLPPGWDSTPQPTQGSAPSPSPTAAACGIVFSDVDSNYWANSYIYQLACSGVLGGYADGTFRPENPTTRAQLVKMIVLTEGWTLANPEQPTFQDVDGSHLFFRYVETAYAHGMIHGYPGGLFKPDAYVTRAEVAKMLVLATGWDLTVPSAYVLCDVPTTHWAWNFIQVAIQHGAFSGYANGCFMPDSYATRAQLAKVIVQSHQ
jgi:hypothetical protein